MPLRNYVTWRVWREKWALLVSLLLIALSMILMTVSFNGQSWAHLSLKAEDAGGIVMFKDPSIDIGLCSVVYTVKLMHPTESFSGLSFNVDWATMRRMNKEVGMMDHEYAGGVASLLITWSLYLSVLTVLSLFLAGFFSKMRGYTLLCFFLTFVLQLSAIIAWAVLTSNSDLVESGFDDMVVASDESGSGFSIFIVSCAITALGFVTLLTWVPHDVVQPSNTATEVAMPNVLLALALGACVFTGGLTATALEHPVWQEQNYRTFYNDTIEGTAPSIHPFHSLVRPLHDDPDGSITSTYIIAGLELAHVETGEAIMGLDWANLRAYTRIFLSMREPGEPPSQEQQDVETKIDSFERAGHATKGLLITALFFVGLFVFAATTTVLWSRECAGRKALGLLIGIVCAVIIFLVFATLVWVSVVPWDPLFLVGMDMRDSESVCAHKPIPGDGFFYLPVSIVLSLFALSVLIVNWRHSGGRSAFVEVYTYSHLDLARDGEEVSDSHLDEDVELATHTIESLEIDE